MSSPQIFARASPALTSIEVQVGERKARVSDMMAESIRPAISRGISRPASWYSW